MQFPKVYIIIAHLFDFFKGTYWTSIQGSPEGLPCCISVRVILFSFRSEDPTRRSGRGAIGLWGYGRGSARIRRFCCRVFFRGSANPSTLPHRQACGSCGAYTYTHPRYPAQGAFYRQFSRCVHTISGTGCGFVCRSSRKDGDFPT